VFIPVGNADRNGVVEVVVVVAVAVAVAVEAAVVVTRETVDGCFATMGNFFGLGGSFCEEVGW
jgi:hypothetical protein